MKLEIKIKSGSRITTKVIEVGVSTLFSMLQDCYILEICKELGLESSQGLDGYIVSLKDKD